MASTKRKQWRFSPPLKTRWFEGKAYRLHFIHPTAAIAKHSAKIQRQKGFLARCTKVEHPSPNKKAGYAVYRRRK